MPAQQRSNCSTSSTKPGAPGRIRDDDARFVVETRIFADQIATASARRGTTKSAPFQRRWKAEARIAA
jgi:hypothetical protein